MNEKISQNDYLLIGEIANRSGVAISTLHFYEKKGFISSKRNSKNQRIFKRGILRIISLIKFAQNLGFSLDDINKNLKSLKSKETPSEKEWKKLTKNWQFQLDLRIKEMQKLRNQLDRCIGCGCMSLGSCPLRNKNDKLSQKGEGPLLLKV